MRRIARIPALIVRIQDAFLKAPTLALTVRQAQRRFTIDEPTCRTLLDVLADAAVLTRSPDGIYRRHFPVRQTHAA